MPEVVITWELDAVTVDVPFDVVPSKYIVPLLPFVAVSVALPHEAPPPLTVTAVGSASTVINWVVELVSVLPAVPPHPAVVRLMTQK